MGDTLHNGGRFRDCVATSATPGKGVSKKQLVASIPKSLPHTIYKHVSSLNNGRTGGGVAWDLAVFLLKIAALETIRRVSRAKCPFVWNTLQALQCLCYPPLKWIQRWAPFKGLINGMQTLSRPLLVLSIATVFSDQSERCIESSDSISPNTDSESHPEPPNLRCAVDTRNSVEGPQSSASEDWLIKLREELGKQQITLPGRINEDELRRFYRVANGDFLCLLSSIKKTIRWRNTYRILSEEELEQWSNLVFWHGLDVKHRPCLVVRLGLACLELPSNEKPRFAQAVISQVEHGVLHLVDPENPHITVLVDCEGLSPLRIPMQMMRSCSSILQDHFPNRLGCLFVIRLPPVVRVIAQTFIQVLRPNTRKKLRIEGEMFRRILSEYLDTLPAYLGGDCKCKRCANLSTRHTPSSPTYKRSKKETNIDAREEEDLQAPQNFTFEDDLDVVVDFNQVIRTAIVFTLMLWIFGALIAGIYDLEIQPFWLP